MWKKGLRVGEALWINLHISKKVHQLIEELLAMLPANNPVVVTMRNELVEERKSKKA